MQEHFAALSDMLQKLHKEERPSKCELRQMAKTLGVPQRNIEVSTLFENIQHAFLQPVESLREGRCEHPVVRQILQDVVMAIDSEAKPAASHNLLHLNRTS